MGGAGTLELVGSAFGETGCDEVVSSTGSGKGVLTSACCWDDDHQGMACNGLRNITTNSSEGGGFHKMLAQIENCPEDSGESLWSTLLIFI